MWINIESIKVNCSECWTQIPQIAQQATENNSIGEIIRENRLNEMQSTIAGYFASFAITTTHRIRLHPRGPIPYLVSIRKIKTVVEKNKKKNRKIYQNEYVLQLGVVDCTNLTTDNRFGSSRFARLSPKTVMKKCDFNLTSVASDGKYQIWQWTTQLLAKRWGDNERQSYSTSHPFIQP